MNTEQIHPSVANYFSSSNSNDATAFAESFAHDAVVMDEGAVVQGLEAVLEWRRRTTEEYRFSMEPLAVWKHGDGQVVQARVKGKFPGSPIELFYLFELRDERIVRLETMDHLPKLDGLE